MKFIHITRLIRSKKDITPDFDGFRFGTGDLAFDILAITTIVLGVAAIVAVLIWGA